MKYIKRILVTLAIILMLACTSCVSYEDADGRTRIGLSAPWANKIEKGAEGVTDILGILSAFIPVLTPVAAAAATGTVVFKKMKKDVTKYKTPLEHTVATLETIKVEAPETWEYVKGKIKEQHPTIDVEQTIEEVIEALKNQGVA